MAGLIFGPFARRLKALIYKNFLVSVIRRPIGFFLCIYGIPIAVLAVLASIPDFIASTSKHGISSPEPISTLADVIDKKLVVCRPDYLHEEVDRVIEKIVEGIDPELIQYEEDDNQLGNICLANLRGVSPCYAGLTFFDTPNTTEDIPPEYQVVAYGEEYNHTWSFTMRFDPARTTGKFDANTHNNYAERYQLPLHLAVNNAITNSSTVPDIFAWTSTTPEEKERKEQEDAVSLISGTYVFSLFACYLFIVYRHVSLITSERESGMSQLIDSMGSGHAAVSRVLSWLLTFNIYCFPVWIFFGIIHWQILFPSGGAGLMIGWQILVGLAVNSSTVFAASFFAKSRVSAIYVLGGFLLLAVGGQVFSQSYDPLPTPAGAYLLSFLFPSSNFVLFAIQMCYWERANVAPDLSKQPPVPEPAFPPSYARYDITNGEMLGFLAVQIIIYPILAIIVEKLMHGIDFKSRSFASVGNNTGGAVAETFELRKHFTPNVLEKFFFCGRRKEVKAVNGVSIQGHKGEILCLVGPNGSGKTTTLHMMSGFIKPTSGTVNLGITPSEIGICPQRNTLWDDLTVDEHVKIWSQIKASNESASELAQLVDSCDLDAKRSSRGNHLSGGQKRKLQLACMFVGGSSVCLIDECTSGLDPLSRRVIWDILLEQRAKRSIVFTTHFLDEVDVLADQIVILTKGAVNCQGPSAELKSIHGGGYRVSVPAAAAIKTEIPYPSTTHQDRIVYTTPDSRTAAQVSAIFNAAGVQDIGFNGPQVEDVFLRVADEGSLASPRKSITSNTPLEFDFEKARVTSFGSQLWTLFLKRVTILKRFWFPYFWVVALPLIITPFLEQLTQEFKPPTCDDLAPELWAGTPRYIYNGDYCDEDATVGACDFFAISPPSANETLHEITMEGFNDLSQLDNQTYFRFPKITDNIDAMYDYVNDNKDRISGAIGIGEDGEPPVIGFVIMDGGYVDQGYAVLNIWSEMSYQVEIISMNGEFADSLESPSIAGTIYAVFFTLIQAIWPATFVLYPAIEKARKVRAIEYANGVRRGPLWLAYGLFDAMFVFIISVSISAIMTTQLTWWNGPPFIMFPILLLYGMAAVLLGYVISHFVTGPLKSFLATAGVALLMYAIAAIAFSVGSGFSGAETVEPVTNGITFGLNLILPIGNVLRALLIGANVSKVGCRDGEYTAPHSIYAYGGPILYLAMQVAVLLAVIIWIEGDLALFRQKGAKAAVKASARDIEMKPSPSAVRSAEVMAEKERVENSDEDLLRILSLDKSFGSNHSVQNVSLGLPENDVMALLGPNGAGKSTLVNMIQSELSPDNGRILLQGEDSRTRSAQRYLGVCPQFDALDLMSTREHLEFYARVKGIRGIKENVEQVMSRLDLTVHAKTNASKLSGGNKRKLSLAIALMGAPPVMVLDEPTSAMDAVAKPSFWKLVQEITPGRSVFLTTHSMEEADTLATRAAIISRRLLAVGTTGALREKYSNVYYVSLLLASASNASESEMGTLQAWVIENIPGAQLERKTLGGQIRFTIPGSDAQGRSPVAEVIELLEREKERLGVRYYNIEGATLERVFLSVAKENNAVEEDGVPRRGFVSRILRR